MASQAPQLPDESTPALHETGRLVADAVRFREAEERSLPRDRLRREVRPCAHAQLGVSSKHGCDRTHSAWCACARKMNVVSIVKVFSDDTRYVRAHEMLKYDYLTARPMTWTIDIVHTSHACPTASRRSQRQCQRTTDTRPSAGPLSAAPPSPGNVRLVHH